MQPPNGPQWDSKGHRKRAEERPQEKGGQEHRLVSPLWSGVALAMVTVAAEATPSMAAREQSNVTHRCSGKELCRAGRSGMTIGGAAYPIHKGWEQGCRLAISGCNTAFLLTTC